MTRTALLAKFRRTGDYMNTPRSVPRRPRPLSEQPQRPTCAWPSCEKPLADPHDFPEVPLCLGHVYEVWRLARDSADRRHNLTPTLVTTAVINGDSTPRKIEQPLTQSGWIYYLRIGESIKIGYAADFEKRLRAYPPAAQVLCVHPGTVTDEKVTHSLLHVHRNAGREWYDDCPEVLDYIEKMKAKHPDHHTSDPRIKSAPTYDNPPRIKVVRG